MPLGRIAEHVVATHPTIAKEQAGVRALDARLAAARAGYLPQFDAGVSLERRRLDVAGGSQNDDTFTARQGDVEGRLPLFDGFRTRNSVRVARAERGAGVANLDAAVGDVLLDLVIVHSDLLRDRQIQGYAQQQSDSIARQMQATNRRLEFGEATRTDSSQARARLASAQAQLTKAREDAQTAERAFVSVTGISAPGALPSSPALPAMPASVAEARQIALAANPGLRSAKLQTEAARQAIGVARSALLPSVQVAAGGQFLSGGVPNLFTGRLPQDRSALYAGVRLTAPIFNGPDHAEVRRARSVWDQREAQTDEIEREVVLRLDTAWLQWESAKSVVEISREAVRANEEAVAGVQEEALNGNRTLLDVLNAQGELLNAQVALARAERDETVAQAAVLAAMGRLTLSTLAGPQAEPRPLI